MDVHHIFIFSNSKGEETDELVNSGLSEGSFRVHKGQGTQNRKFYFQNFYLEILWVIDNNEFRSPLTSSAKLCDRADYQKNGYSPFGLCLVNSSENDILFQNSFKYSPEFLPEGVSFDVITNENTPYLPWTFRPPFMGRGAADEPFDHKIGIQKLTKIIFFCPHLQSNTYLNYFKNVSNISFINSDHYHLLLEFDNKRKGSQQTFIRIPLTIEY